MVCFNSDGSPVVSLLSDLIRSLAEIVRDAAEKKCPAGLHRTTVLPVPPWQDSAVAYESGHCGIRPGQEMAEHA